MKRPTVVIGLLGPRLDDGFSKKRWDRWRPSVSLGQQEDLAVDRVELLHESRFTELAERVAADIRQVSPATTVNLHQVAWKDAWDLEQTYAALHDWALAYPFKPEREDYLVHITTGTHIAQIVLFLLTEARYFPGRLIQTMPPSGRDASPRHTLIDLDLSRYDGLAGRFRNESRAAVGVLKNGIETRNASFNRLMDRLEHVVLNSTAPLLLTGPSGAGKTQLANRIHALRKQRRLIKGDLVSVNCATLRGDQAMGALFGHVRGAFTGATGDRPGLLRQADGGMLFLDEIGELGLDEQAMLLRAIEEKVFLPVGSDREVSSSFQLVAGTNRDLHVRTAEGRFRADLLARINLWSFELPGLAQRPEDLEPNLDFELARVSAATNTNVTLSREARTAFLQFARSPEAVWTGNFRDLGGAVTRMATLAQGGRISVQDVREEAERLLTQWRPVAMARSGPDVVDRLLGKGAPAEVDLFDRAQLATVLTVCANARSLADAGRQLFAVSRAQRTSVNDSDRLRKYLARFGLEWADVHGGGGVA